MGVDVAVNVVGTLDEEGQADLASMLINEASDDHDEVIAPAWIRDRVDDVHRTQEQRRAFEAAVAAAEARGATVKDQRELERQYGPALAGMRVSDDEITAAAEAGALMAYVQWWGARAHFFDTRKTGRSEEDVAVDQAPPAPSTSQVRKAEWQQLQKDTWTWVQAHPRPPRVKDDLLQTLADHVLEVMRAETGKRVHQWLIALGKVDEGSDYYGWLNEVTGRSPDADGPVEARVRVAWLATVAHDMEQARHHVNGQPAERAIARAAEVQ